MKTYKIVWLSEDGSQFKLGEVTTKHPKHALCDEVVKLMVKNSNTFQKLEHDTIMKNVHEGKMKREHYFMKVEGIFGEQYISLMEA